jgi:hypothetical protein
MAVKVKAAADAATKFVANAQAAAPAYGKGVANAGATWQTSTAAAADNWQQGVQQAAAQGRFAAGVNNASASKYQTRASGVGVARYPQGVAGAQSAYQNGVAPYLTTIQNLTLPPRAPRGSPSNNQRVNVITQALRAQKLGQSS